MPKEAPRSTTPAIAWSIGALLVLVVGAMVSVPGLSQASLYEALERPVEPFGPAFMPILNRSCVFAVVLLQGVLAFGGWEQKTIARIVAMAIAFTWTTVNGLAVALWLESLNEEAWVASPVVPAPGWWFRGPVALVVTGAAAVLWIVSDKLSATRRAHGFLIIALFHTGLDAVFNPSIEERMSLRLMRIAVMLCAISIGVIAFVRRPAAWPVHLNNRFEVRSGFDLAAIPAFLGFVVPEAVNLVAMLLPQSWRGEWLLAVGPLLAVGLSIALAVHWLRLVPPSSPVSS
jgi:hypothetical protein